MELLKDKTLIRNAVDYAITGLSRDDLIRRTGLVIVSERDPLQFFSPRFLAFVEIRKADVLEVLSDHLEESK